MARFKIVEVRIIFNDTSKMKVYFPLMSNIRLSVSHINNHSSMPTEIVINDPVYPNIPYVLKVKYGEWMGVEQIMVSGMHVKFGLTVDHVAEGIIL